jgi:hypothetical protein
MTINKRKCKYTLVWKCLYFGSWPFKIYMCCKFLGPYRTHIYVNMFTLDVAVFYTQVVKGTYFFTAIPRGLLNYMKKVILT